jgi:predicted DNA-binding transcriptional regulator YafY
VKRTHRLFAIAEYLRGRRTGVTVSELAERFEVSDRTMFRDLEALRDASLPVQGERGRGGGIALDRSYSLPPVNFSAREAALLVAIGRYVSEMRVVPFTDTLEAALDKVRSALSASAQRQLLAHVETLLFVGVPAHTAPPAVRRTLEEAWFEGVPLWIRYAGARETTTRLVRIESVIMERTETLVNAFDLDKKEQRQFKLERIEDASIECPAPEQVQPAFTAARQLTVRRPRDR